jgi:hypothetical protein
LALHSELAASAAVAYRGELRQCSVKAVRRQRQLVPSVWLIVMEESLPLANRLPSVLSKVLN